MHTHHYCLAGQAFRFPCPIAEIEPFEDGADGEDPSHSFLYSFPGNESPKLISRAKGWVANAQRTVEVYGSKSGFLLKVEDCSEFFISQNGESIGKQNLQEELSQLDREIILGPALVLALALRNIWSLHASAAMYKENTIVFLGESGRGKSTLAAYLAQHAGWRLVADDILPVKINEGKVNVLPHFPQLKLPTDAQPGVNFPESLPLKTICILEHAEADQAPELQKISTAQTVQVLLGHIAGTRMFGADLLTKHLAFSTQAAAQVTAYQLKYPQRKDALPLVKGILENLC